MIINKGWVYVRVPRTASSSMSAVFAPYHEKSYDKYSVSDYYKGEKKYGFDMSGKHFTMDHIYKSFPGIVDKKSFAFVRNPYDRIVSYYYHYKQKRSVGSFENFVLKFIRDNKKLSAYPFWTNQNKWLTINGLICVDKIGRFEKLKEHFSKITKEYTGKDLYNKLPHKKKSQEKKDYKTYYTTKTQEIVYQNCKKDFNMFNYSEEL